MLPTVPVPPKRLDDLLADTGEEAVERLREAAEPLKGARILMLNSTAFGGGVAELLQTQVGILQDLGIEAVWAVMEGADPFFDVTKTVHNGMQGAEVAWTRGMERTYWDTARENAERLLDERFDVWFIHDPQPVGIRRILAEYGHDDGTWIWRCHIDLSDPNAAVWGFFEPFVNAYDGAIFTMEEFSQPGLDGPEVAFIPPSIDPTSAKNVDLSTATVHDLIATFGVDPDRPIVTQVSRFDPWKDPIGVIDVYRVVREEVGDLQLVLAGSMAHDDPEGMRYLDLTEEHRRNDPDIHLLTNVQMVGNTDINAFQRASVVGIQKSLREGFGLVVAEAMWKRKPVVGGNVGGVRLQIEEGKSGYLVDSVEACAQRTIELLRDPDLCRAMGEAARARVHERFLTTRELEDYLRLMGRLAGGGNGSGGDGV
ncbi:MAG: glycosyltransferase [Actinomycetota bacterium]